MKNVLLTFDYELFFKESGSLVKSIINPTNHFINYSKKFGVKGIFFVDILYYSKLLQGNEELREQASLIKKQLTTLLKLGNRIELHLHPHWVDAVYNEKTKHWSFNSMKHYRLHSLAHSVIEEMFEDGCRLIEGIAKEVDCSYKVKAFRAGGWCIQPSDDIANLMIKNGIIYDSSVLPMHSSKGSVHYYDYRCIINDNEYKFSNSVIEKDAEGELMEFPVSIYRDDLINKLSNKIYNVINKEAMVIYGDGVGVSAYSKTSLPSIFRSLILPKIKPFSLEYGRPSRIVSQVMKKSNDMVIFVSHPKYLNVNSWRILDKMIQKGIVFKNDFRIDIND